MRIVIVMDVTAGEAVRTDAEGKEVERFWPGSHAVATMAVGTLCTNRSPYPARCRNEGAGWVYERDHRPPTYLGSQYVCRECACNISESEEMDFTPGRVCGTMRVLEFGWFIRTDDED